MESKKVKTFISLPSPEYNDPTKSYHPIHTPILNIRKMERAYPDLFKPPASPQELKNKKYTEQFINCIEKITRKTYSVETRQKIVLELGNVADSINQIVKHILQNDQKQITDTVVEIPDCKID